MTHVEMGNKQKLGGIADFWAGKLEGQEVYVKVFRQHEGEKQEKIKEVSAFPIWRNRGHQSTIIDSS